MTDTDAAAPDPFDVARLRLAPDDDDALGVTELLTSVPYRKPSKEWFVRVRPGDDHRATGGLVELKDDGDSDAYWVDPSLWPLLSDEPAFGKRLVVTAVSRSGVVFLWGLRLPGPDGKVPDWVGVPLEAAKAAERQWVKLFWDQGQRRHRVRAAAGIRDEPAWPDRPFAELLRLAFKDRVVASPDHPVLRRLRGES